MKVLLTILLTFVFTANALAPEDYQTFVATAYSIKGRMANGEYVHQGAIAADWKVLPRGSRVHIKGMGVFIVKDTGSRIKGNRIDIYMPSSKAAIKFGKRKVQLKKL